MAEPAKKRSRTRTRRARANQKIEATQLVLCPQCRAQIRSHQICPQCGYYRGAKVLGE